jgi:DNA invertase Pin-like site-specific DNA recombinase
MSIYGYHRTSTNEQHLDRGIQAITEYCQSNNIQLEKIFTDQQTGKNFNRPRYTIMKEDVLRKGDTLIISEIDRLGRNKEDTLKELRYFKDNAIRVMILEIPTTLIDYRNLENSMATMIMETVNNMLIEMYTVFAQVEIEKKEKRQREGIEAKKARGEWSDYGRPKAIDFEIFKKEYQRVMNNELKPFECMRLLGLTKPTFYRYKQQFEEGR